MSFFVQCFHSHKSAFLCTHFLHVHRNCFIAHVPIRKLFNDPLLTVSTSFKPLITSLHSKFLIQTYNELLCFNSLHQYFNKPSRTVSRCPLFKQFHALFRVDVLHFKSLHAITRRFALIRVLPQQFSSPHKNSRCCSLYCRTLV